jgi:hypothetical protein
VTAATASVYVAAIMAVASLAVAVINNRRHGVAIAENTEQTKQVLHQVQNDHRTNLRDDLDDLRTVVMERLDTIDTNQAELGAKYEALSPLVLKAIRHAKDHDVASTLVVDALKARDDALEKELHQWRPGRAGPSATSPPEPGSPQPTPEGR